MEERKVAPPWVPNDGGSLEPSVDNFVSWDGLSVPTYASADAQKYCNGIKIPLAGRHTFAPETNLPASTSIGTPSTMSTSRKSMRKSSNNSNSDLSLPKTRGRSGSGSRKDSH